MKIKHRRVMAIVAVLFAACFALVGVGYLYLRSASRPTEGTASKIPYSFSKPENRGIMLEMCGDKTFFYLDFEEERLLVIFPTEESDSKELYGYPIDFGIKADYTLLAWIIDNIGGIELDDGDGTLRYTGVQIKEKLSRTADIGELKRNIIVAVTERIAERGAESEMFTYIIENTETDITYPDCFNWDIYADKLCRGLRIIN